MKIKRLANLLVIGSAAMFVFSTNVAAQQDPAKATENVIQTTDKIENMRAQIAGIETKKAALQDRIRQLDDAMLPENLERNTATAGSTHPEDLRENRRLQLETEKKAVQSQIDLLEQNRLRIEMSIATTTPKAAPAAETTPTKTQKTENAAAAQTQTQNTVTAETATVTPSSPVKRSSAKNKRKRIVKTN